MKKMYLVTINWWHEYSKLYCIMQDLSKKNEVLNTIAKAYELRLKQRGALYYEDTEEQVYVEFTPVPIYE